MPLTFLIALKIILGQCIHVPVVVADMKLECQLLNSKGFNL